MLFADYFLWALIALGFVVSLPAIWMVSRALWPAGYERRHRIAQGNLWKTALIGVLPMVFSVLVLAATGKRIGVLAVLVAGLVVLWGLSGLSGLATVIGERLWPREDEPWRQTRNGGLVLVCCALLPVVGWFILLPLLTLVGMGANVQSWRLRREAAPAAPPALPVA